MLASLIFILHGSKFWSELASLTPIAFGDFKYTLGNFGYSLDVMIFGCCRFWMLRTFDALIVTPMRGSFLPRSYRSIYQPRGVFSTVLLKSVAVCFYASGKGISRCKERFLKRLIDLRHPGTVVEMSRHTLCLSDFKSSEGQSIINTYVIERLL